MISTISLYSILHPRPSFPFLSFPLLSSAPTTKLTTYLFFSHPPDVLGSLAFTPVKNDLLSNISKIRTYQHSASISPSISVSSTTTTLQSLVRSELATKKHVATEGLLWLLRGLDFTAQALRHNVSHPTEELSASFRHAYAETLKPHHSFLVKPIFSAAMGACPYRKEFYRKLGDEGTEAEVQAILLEWLAALEAQVVVLKAFMAKEGKW